jgi:hypothetical protein
MLTRLPLVSSMLAAVLLTAACSDSNTLSIDPPAPSSLTVFPTAAPEGAPGELRTLSFRVVLTEPQPGGVLVPWRTEALTATAGEDYYDASGEALIPAGALETRIDIELLGDADPEPAETFRLVITTSSNASPTANEAIGTIANDDVDCSAPFVKADPNRWRVADGADPLNYAHRGGVIDFPRTRSMPTVKWRCWARMYWKWTCTRPRTTRW